MGLKQTEVAKLLGHSGSSELSKWEKGISKPSLDNILKLSFLYKTLVNDLYFDLYSHISSTLHQKKELKDSSVQKIE